MSIWMTVDSMDELLDPSGWVRSLARSLLVDPADVEDVTQQAMLQALRVPSGSVVAPRSWLRRVVHNVVANRARQEQRRRVREEAAAGDLVKPADPSAASVAATLELHREIVAAVAGLAEPYRTVLTLHYFESLSTDCGPVSVGWLTAVAGSWMGWKVSAAIGAVLVWLLVWWPADSPRTGRRSTLRSQPPEAVANASATVAA